MSAAPRSQTWSTARRLLCVRLDSIGDVLMTTPALRALREQHPERHITLLTSPAGAEVAGMVPEVDATIVYAAPWMKATHPREDPAHEYAMARRLRRKQLDAAVIFTVYSQSPLPAATLCYLAGISLRLAHCRENPYQLLSDWVHETEPAGGVRHEVRRQLDLVAAVGARTADERLSLRVPEEDGLRAERLLEEQGIDRAKPWVVIHPGASAPSRRYPQESYARAARRLAGELGWQVVWSGAAEEVLLVQRIQDAMVLPSASLAGQLDLAALAALIRLAPLLITNNTGPAHIAAAVGTPVVDLYALTNPQHTPWLVESRVLSHDVPCKYCYKSVCPQGHHDCLRRISPEAVVRAAQELLCGTSGLLPDAIFPSVRAFTGGKSVVHVRDQRRLS